MDTETLQRFITEKNMKELIEEKYSKQGQITELQGNLRELEQKYMDLMKQTKIEKKSKLLTKLFSCSKDSKGKVHH